MCISVCMCKKDAMAGDLTSTLNHLVRLALILTLVLSVTFVLTLV